MAQQGFMSQIQETSPCLEPLPSDSMSGALSVTFCWLNIIPKANAF